MTDATRVSVFGAQKYLSLETYRKNGAGVRTAVWFAVAPGCQSALKSFQLTASKSFQLSTPISAVFSVV